MFKATRICLGLATLLTLTVLAASAFAQTALHCVAFTAPWCYQCQLDKQYYPRLEAQFGKLTVYDYDTNQEAAKRWGVTKLPTYIVVLSDGTTFKTENINDLL